MSLKHDISWISSSDSRHWPVWGWPIYFQIAVTVEMNTVCFVVLLRQISKSPWGAFFVVACLSLALQI